MAASVNKAILIGNLGRDPEVRTFQNGGKVVNLSVATSESWRDKASGERKERTEWHKVSVTAEGAAKFAEQYLRKGSKVYIEGQIETEKWQDQSGQDRFTTKIVVRAFGGVLQSLDSREDGDRRGGGGDDRRDDRRDDSRSSGGGSSARGAATGGAGGANDMDDEIPFAPEVR